MWCRIFSSTTQQGATLHNLFISVKCSARFTRFHRPSSGAQNCIYSIGYFVKPLLLPATVSSNSSTTVAGSSRGLTKYPMLYIQFLAPDDGRRNLLKHAEHFTEINKLCNVASCWLYFKTRLRCTDPWTSNWRKMLFHYGPALHTYVYEYVLIRTSQKTKVFWDDALQHRLTGVPPLTQKPSQSSPWQAQCRTNGVIEKGCRREYLTLMEWNEATEKYLGHLESSRNIRQKLKCTLVQALRLCTGHTPNRGSRGIALPFLDHGTRMG